MLCFLMCGVRSRMSNDNEMNDDAREDIPSGWDDTDADSVIPQALDLNALYPSIMEWEWPAVPREDEIADDEMPPLVNTKSG